MPFRCHYLVSSNIKSSSKQEDIIKKTQNTIEFRVEFPNHFFYKKILYDIEALFNPAYIIS